LKLLDEEVDANFEVKQIVMAVVEKERLLDVGKSELSEGKLRLLKLIPNKPKKWVRVCFLVLSILFCWGIPYIIAAMAWRRAETNPELKITREKVQRLTLETQELESKLSVLQNRRSDALKKLKMEFVAELDFRRVPSGVVSPEEYTGVIRDCVEQFQESLPYRCKINPALVSVKWCEASYKSLINELSELATKIVAKATLNEEGLFVCVPPAPFFKVILVSVPADKKIAVIKALREVKPGLGLAEAKKLVETLPSKVFEGVSETAARAAKEKLEQAYAGVRLEAMA
jgi:ribosomal protein L7/L12